MSPARGFEEGSMVGDGCRRVFAPLAMGGVAVGGHVIVVPVKAGCKRRGNRVDFLRVGCCGRHTGNNANLVVMRGTDMSSPRNSGKAARLHVSRSGCLPHLCGFYRRVRGCNAYVTVRVGRTNTSTISTHAGVRPISTSSIPSGRNKRVPHPLSIRRVRRVMGGCNRTTGETRTTNFSTMRVRTKRSCLVDRFLSPLAGGHASRFNKSIRGEAHFYHVIVRRMEGRIKPFFPVVLHLDTSRLVRNNGALRSALRCLRCIRSRISVFSISYNLGNSVRCRVSTGCVGSK